MLEDKVYDIQYMPFFKTYNKIEKELILKVIQRINIQHGIQGSAEWYIKKLADMGALKKEVYDFIATETASTPDMIREMVENVSYLAIDFTSYDKALALNVTDVNVRDIPLEQVLEGSYDTISEQFNVVKTKAVEGTLQAYKDTITKAHLEVSTGVYSYDESIRKGVKDLADKGITTATYIRGGQEVNYGMEAIVRRNVMTGIGQVANNVNAKIVEELGAEHIATSEHLGARNKGDGHVNHEWWQGKVYKVNGFDRDYDNFYTHTGYGEIDGLGGINCRHTHWAYFPGISVPIERRIDDAENTRVYNLEQKQRQYERNIRKAKRRLQAYQEAKDDTGVKHSRKLIRSRQARLKDFIEENSDVLRRDYPREQI